MSRYGARKGAEIPEAVDEQLRLAHELREELVAIVHPTVMRRILQALAATSIAVGKQRVR